MSSSTKSQNPAVRAILEGTAPPQARMAAASGMLPLPQFDLVEVLVNLLQEDDPEISEAATETLAEQDKEDLLAAATNDETSPTVLDYLGTLSGEYKQIHEAVILNRNTSDRAIANLAAATQEGSLLELISLNQQRSEERRVGK